MDGELAARSVTFERAKRRASALAFDLTRTLLGFWRSTPRGIDRVELQYAEEFFSHWPGNIVGILTTPFGSCVLSKGRAVALLRSLKDFWREDEHACANDELYEVRAWLTGAREPSREDRTRAHANARRVLRQLAALGALCSSLSRDSSAVPRNGIYLNLGHVGLAFPKALRWLERRPDVTPVFMLHDIIPIEFPEFVPRMSARFHARMVESAMLYARVVLAPTAAAGIAIGRELAARGKAGAVVRVAPHAVSPVFARKAQSELGALSGKPYFVICGAIERRKNHMFLLQLWRDLVREHHDDAPRLVIVGSPWHSCRITREMLDRNTDLSKFVFEARGLSSPAVRALITNARALLAPSFAEGFGLPVIEALACGTPVIASDIAAHREAGGQFATYLDVLDGPSWRREILRLCDADESARRSREALEYSPPTWRSRAEEMRKFLLSLPDAVSAASQGRAKLILQEI